MRGTKVLFVDSSGNTVVAKYNLIYKIVNDQELYICTLPIAFSAKVLSRFKLYYRAKRLGVGASIEYDSAYYFVFQSKIYRYDLLTRALTIDFDFPQGRGPLSFTIIENIPGFKDGLYFGEYISNRSKKPVSIFHRNVKWETVYSFKEATVNHIHGLVADDFRKCVWILAGDFGDAAAIFNSKDGFSSVQPIVSGSQIYRACVAFPIKEGLLYATDTQIEKNSVRILKENAGIWRSEFLYGLNGSCIYGCELRDYYVFSTSTEPSEVAKNKLHSLLDNKPAPAIISNKSDVVVCRKSDFDFKIVYSVSKDVFPYRLFQFGTIMFPSGTEYENIIYAYNIGSVENDLSTVVMTCE